MTLARRLLILLIVGAIMAWGAYRMLWTDNVRISSPTPAATTANPFTTDLAVGEYVRKDGKGSYRLSVLEGNKAKLEFADEKSQRFAYRGDVIGGKIVWTQQLHGKKWTALKQPVDDSIGAVSSKTVELREGVFTRAAK
jgi:hypothetical protein